MDYLVDELRARKNEIAKEMNSFDKAFDRFVRFWTSYYEEGMSCDEVVDIYGPFLNILVSCQV